MIPSKAHPSDAGYDLTAIDKDSDAYGNISYNTKLAISIPIGYVGLLFPRSSISKRTQTLANSVGVLDPGYTGPIVFKFKPTPHYATLTNKDALLEYEVGDKIGQLIVVKTESLEFEEIDELASSARGNNGFGSSTQKNQVKK